MKRLSRWLESKPAPKDPRWPWRVGNPDGRSLYEMNTGAPDQDKFLGVMETADLAQFVIKAVNYQHSLAPAPKVLHDKKQKQKHKGPTSLLGWRSKD